MQFNGAPARVTPGKWPMGTTRREAPTSNAAAKTYIDLYKIDSQSVRIQNIKANIDAMLATVPATVTGPGLTPSKWQCLCLPSWGLNNGGTTYFEKMHSMYANTKTTQGLYNATDHLWWRDTNFKPPFTTPNGKQCYWSRGNGWVFAALTRVLDTIPSSEAHRSEYVSDFTAMAGALRLSNDRMVSGT